MDVIKDLAALRIWQQARRADSASWALVPTMGNLHSGHIALMHHAHAYSENVMASIYVNPTQFGANEDFARYPRTPEDDLEKLREAGVSAVFMPDDDLIYPFGRDAAIGYTLPGVYSDILCGAHRPGHFNGVVAVVSRLLHLIAPDYAVFGEKDYQQQWILRRMVADLHFPVTLISAPTVREADGLAMSSRNQYLSVEERARAPLLAETLHACRDAITAGEDSEKVLSEARAALLAAGFQPDYLELRCRADLSPAADSSKPVVLLVAATLGQTRLIDNVIFGGAKYE